MTSPTPMSANPIQYTVTPPPPSSLPPQTPPTSPISTQTWNTKNLGWRLCTDTIAAICAASSVAPLIAIIDRGIMENASGVRPLRASLSHSLLNLLTSPRTLLTSKPFFLICMVYSGTYATANILDTLTATIQDRPATLTTTGTLKFALPSASNIGLCLIKDASFAKLFGPKNTVPRPVPGPSYILFAARDCLTIFASFNVPPLLGPLLDTRLSVETRKRLSGQTMAQFLAPAGVQLISTPLHLLGLDLYNRPKASLGQRWELIRGNWGVSAAARICRIVPAFGVGGVVNLGIRKRGMERLI